MSILGLAIRRKERKEERIPYSRKLRFALYSVPHPVPKDGTSLSAPGEVSGVRIQNGLPFLEI